MKKFYLAFVIIAAASIAAGCSKEPTQPTPAAKEKITLTAGASETKTYGIETIRFNTTDPADHLSIFDSEGENNDFALTSTSGASGEFSGEITGGSSPLFAIYPYNAEASLSGTNITTTLGNHFRAYNKDSILRDMNLSIGQITGSAGSYAAELKNVCGILGIHIPADVIGVKNVKLTANESLAGNVTIDYNSGEPSVVSAPDGAKSVDFDIPANNGLQWNDTKFYFCIIPGTYTGIKITITLLNGKTKEFSSSNPVTVVRNGRILLKDLTLAEVQDVPAGNLTISIVGGGNKQWENFVLGDDTKLPTTAGTAITTGATFYYNQGDYSYPFYFCANNAATTGKIYYYTPSKTYDKKTYYFHDLLMDNSSKAVITDIRCYLKTPPIPGKKLTRVGFTHAHDASSKTTRILKICGTLKADGGNNSDPDNDYFTVVKNASITDVGTVTYVDITTSTAGKSYYIYTQNPNLYLRQLILEYTAVE